MAEEVFTRGGAPWELPAFDYQHNPKISMLLLETGNFAPGNIVPGPEQGECPEMKIPLM